jgi:hypothetical protein
MLINKVVLRKWGFGDSGKRREFSLEIGDC